MQNTSDEFIHSITAATTANEVKWEAGSQPLRQLLEEFFGECSMLHAFEDVAAGAHVVLAGYQYYEGEVHTEEFIRDGMSLLLVDVEDGEILHEITDEDVDDETLFASLVKAIEVQ